MEGSLQKLRMHTFQGIYDYLSGTKPTIKNFNRNAAIGEAVCVLCETEFIGIQLAQLDNQLLID